MFEILTKRQLTTSLVLNNWALIDKIVSACAIEITRNSILLATMDITR